MILDRSYAASAAVQSVAEDLGRQRDCWIAEGELKFKGEGKLKRGTTEE